MSDLNATLFETRAKGKLLLSGEYCVLDGAWALAVPTRFGQSLRIEPWKEPALLSWTSKNEQGTAWYLAEFELPSIEVLNDTDRRITETLQTILRACRQLNPDFLDGAQGWKALTKTDFPREWGLGTSSTLIAALARWVGVDPYTLLFNTMGGSGYDIACAYAEGPLLYRLEGQKPEIQMIDFKPVFTENLFFVYLEKKQDSRAGIQRYRERVKTNPALIDQISGLTRQFVQAKNLANFDEAIRAHEQIISAALDLPRAQNLLFADYWGEVKSLGAWGGDFVLVTSARTQEETRDYFLKKGFPTFLRWADMIAEGIAAAD